MEPLKSSKLNEVISHFEAWRTTRVGKSRIPANLWQEAIALYPAYSISEIIKPLRLGHSDFKKKVSQIEKNLAPTDFIRIDQSPIRTDASTSHQLINDHQTTIELEKGDGSRIRIQRELNDQALISIIKGYFGDMPCYS
ncbi:MAG: hypothetical protein QNL62_14500 [Gammaproteobacteria bacterium]|nr:hypothetical protein [Gammaproteobacteria bacterium]